MVDLSNFRLLGDKHLPRYPTRVQIDDQRIVDIKICAIIGSQFETVFSRLPNPELPVIVDAEPLKSARDSGNAFGEEFSVHIERGGVQCANRIQILESQGIAVSRLDQLDLERNGGRRWQVVTGCLLQCQIRSRTGRRNGHGHRRICPADVVAATEQKGNVGAGS
jgi:hypothetical protein